MWYLQIHFQIISDDTELASLTVSLDDQDQGDKDLKDIQEDLINGMIIAVNYVEVYKCCPQEGCRKKKLKNEGSLYYCERCREKWQKDQVEHNCYAKIAVDCFGLDSYVYLTMFQREIENLRGYTFSGKINYTNEKEVEMSIKNFFGTNIRFTLNKSLDTIQKIYTRKRPISQY